MINRIQAHEALDDFLTHQQELVADLTTKHSGQVRAASVSLRQQKDGRVIAFGTVSISLHLHGVSKTPVNKE